MEDFASFINQQRQQLRERREKLQADREEIDRQLAEIEKEEHAIRAYEEAKSGRTPTPTTSRRRRTGTRRTGIRQDVLNLIKQHPDGISRGDILIAMDAKGDRSREQSISNALAALKRTNAVSGEGGNYRAA
jgi:hypothetical protein